MASTKRLLGSFLLASLFAAVGACGSSGSSPGTGTITLTSIDLDAIVGPAGCSPLTVGVPDAFPSVPTEFAISGLNFETLQGTTAIVRFRAVGGATPFAGGSSATADVEGLVVADTLSPLVRLVCGTTPGVSLCGIATVTATIEVILESGVRDDSTGGPAFVITFNAPTVASVCPGSVIPSMTPVTLDLYGNFFGNAGDAVTVRFVSTENGGVGDPIFNGGSTTSTDVVGIVSAAPGPLPPCAAPGSAQLITVLSPKTTNQVVTDPASAFYSVSDPFEDAEIFVVLGNGSCSGSGTGAAVVFDRPEANRAISVSTAYPAPILPSTQTFAPQQFPTEIVLTGFDDTVPAACADRFGPPGARVRVLLAAPGAPAFAPSLAFQLASNPDPALRVGTENFQVVDGEIVSGTEIRFRTPEIDARNAPFNFPPVITVQFEDGTIVPVELRPAADDSVFTWQARPFVTSLLNMDGGTGNGFFASMGTADDFRASISSTMRVTGQNFTQLTDFFPGLQSLVKVYATFDGLDASGQPVRNLGTGFFSASTNGLGTPFAVTDVGGGGTALGDRIEGETRLEPVLPDLDQQEVLGFNRNGLLTYTVRVVNEDGQFRDFLSGSAQTYIDPTRSDGIVAVNLADVRLTAAQAETNHNCDVAIDPTSSADDFGNSSGGSEAPAAKGMNIAVITGSDPTNVAGPESTDQLIYVSRDGGVNFAAPILLSSLDGLGAVERNFGQAEFDRFGNLWIAYQVDDAVNAVSSVRLIGMTDLGSGAVFSTVVIGVGFQEVVGASLAIGPDGSNSGQDGVYVAYLATPIGPRRVRVFGLQSLGVGASGALAPSVPVDDGIGTGLDHAICSVGPGGELYVSWNDRTPLSVAGPTILMVDSDQDGMFAATFAFTGDTVVDTVVLPTPDRPSSPDAGPRVPHASMATARVGTHSGRVVIAYDDTVADGTSTVRVRVVSAYSDDGGLNWITDVPVTQDSLSDQFLPAITADPRTGRLYCTWTDTRLDATDVATNRFTAASDDGASWGYTSRLSDASSVADGAGFEIDDYGLYAGVAALGGHVVAAWPGNESGAGAGVRMDTFLHLYEQNASTLPSSP